MEEVRYELNHEGKIVEGNAELSSNIEGILTDVFSQYNNTYRELEANGPYRFIEITSPNGEKRYFHLYVGRIRNEKRNPYEKKIQLNGSDPTLTDKKSSIILGVYVYDKDDDYKNAVFVGFPINDNINYASNPSLRGGIFTNQLLEKAKNHGFSYDKNKKTVGFRAEFIFYYLDNFEYFHYDISPSFELEVDSDVADEDYEIIEANDFDKKLSTHVKNKIFFGAPGTGKSWTLNKEKDELLGKNGVYERVTFHPDYSYANFVGCYKPIMRENNSSQVLEGHQKDVFDILQDNSKTTQEKYDILYEKFKNNGEGLTRIPILLGLYCDGDFTSRKTDGSDAVSSVEKNHGKAIRPYVTLLSEKNTDEIAYEYIPGPFMRILVKALKNPQENYLLIIEEINRANIAGVFGDVFQLLDRDNNGNSEYEIQTSEDMRKYLKKELSKDMPTIRIPSNMYIWATMNSADQGVFPMDTAFKRRWSFKYFDIDNGEEAIQDKVVEICGESINWNRLRKAINNELSNNKINEDKLMGAHFLPESVLEDHEKFINAFKNKVIMYLFEDAAKQKRSTIFSGCSNNLRFSSICNEFDVKGIQIFSENIQRDTKE